MGDRARGAGEPRGAGGPRGSRGPREAGGPRGNGEPAETGDPRRKGPPPPRLWEYVLPGGWLVRAGRTEADNDRLSLKLARPDDWWFHARGLPGSHVVLRARDDAEPDRDTLRAAAAIAAWHSKGRASRALAVSCTRARFVSKPRGAPPGTVEIRRETVLKVKPGLPPAGGPGTADPEE